MTPFLKQTASHWFTEGGLEKKCFVFPSRRALAFFKKYLGELAAESGKPVFAPTCTTVNDFFYNISGTKATDKVVLLLELYQCYKSLNSSCETLDEFIFWGDVILADFDDTDKYLADPKSLFTNIAEYKSMQDSYDYLSDTQKKAIEQLLHHFEVNKGEIKEEFRKIWNILFPLYNSFRESLASKNLAYEGMVYRRTAELFRDKSATDILSESYPESDKFIFVGLNALNECEKLVLGKMRNAGIASFEWDWSGEMIRDSHNKSSFFLKDFYTAFPQSFETIDPETLPNFKAISVPSSIGQAKLIPDILKEQGGTVDERTVIVLPDEGLLIPVLNSIPEEIEKLNVTMGFPLNGSSIWGLLQDISLLQQKIRIADGNVMFYHRPVWAIFSSSILKSIISKEGAEAIRQIKEEGRYYIEASKFGSDPVLNAIFRKAGESAAEIEDYLLSLIALIAGKLKEIDDMAIELDFAREFYLAVKRLQSVQLDIAPATFYRLLSKLVAGASVPFKGEPLEGLQIMGPLETRALDFDNVIILSCNEGVFPRHSVSASFVPPELRRAFGLPTYEFQDAVWAYYFYRLIRRATNVTFLYDSRTEGVKAGEESRFIKQLKMHFGVKIKRFVAQPPQIKKEQAGDDTIPKTERHIRILENSVLSATAVENYLKCPALFYYSKIEKLSEEDEVKDAMDSGDIGSVFHKVMELLYKGRDVITEDYIKSIRRSKLVEMCSEQIMEAMKVPEVSGRNLIYRDMIVKYLEKTLECDLEYMNSRKKNSFRILGTELACSAIISGQKFIGFIDRMDSVENGQARILDYKTGSVSEEEMDITDENAETIADKLFTGNGLGKPLIAIQLFVYDKLAREAKDKNGQAVLNGENLQNCIYSTRSMFLQSPLTVDESTKFSEICTRKFEELISEMKNPEVAWERTSDGKACEYCTFKMICGR